MVKKMFTSFEILTECGYPEGREYICGCGYRCESFGEIQSHLRIVHKHFGR